MKMKKYLIQEYYEDIGPAIAIVDIESIHLWEQDEFEAACATYWKEGYWAWVIRNVRPIEQYLEVPAKRKLYWIEIEDEENWLAPVSHYH